MLEILTQHTQRSGAVGMVGGILLFLYAIPDLIAPETFSGSGQIAIVYGLVLLVIIVFLLIGFVGLHTRLQDGTGRLERAGYYLSLIGFVVAIISDLHLYGIAGGDADSFITFILGFFAIIIGSALVGIAGWRADILPRLGAALFIVSPLGIPAVFLLADTTIGTPFVAITAPYGAAWTVVGWYLWTDTL